VTSQQEFDDDSAGIGTTHRGGIGFLACEYAKCKNRPYILKDPKIFSKNQLEP
jgi:hypothetical protein